METRSKKVVVVGSGSAGFTAALAAKETGLEPMDDRGQFWRTFHQPVRFLCRLWSLAI